MSAIVKTKLKAAKEALAKKDFERLKAITSEALEYDPDNSNATVLLGFALLELGDIEQSEQVYSKAVKASPDQLTPLQGLSKVYETAEKWEQYGETLEKLAHLFAKADNATKCAESLQKLIQLRRERGDPLQVADMLFFVLPGSPFYPTLSTLPPPDTTNPTATTTFVAQSAVHNSLPVIEEVIDIFETHEEATFKREVANRRTRLGAPNPEQIKREVTREIWAKSRLPELYQEVLSHPHASDEIRRQAESKLLKHKQQLLFALPSNAEYTAQKAKLSAEVQDLVAGIVLLGIPNELAWSLYLESKNAKTIDEYDVSSLSQFVRLFPNLPLSRMVSAYFSGRGTSLVTEDEEGNKKPQTFEDDYSSTILDLYSDISSSILGHRLVAETYQSDEDYENVIKVAEDGLEITIREERNCAIQLPRVKSAFNVLLATALVHFYPPKHHVRARRILDDVLQEDPDNVSCLMGLGYVQEYAKRWSDASETFARVIQLRPDDLEVGLRAKEELAWSKAQVADPDKGVKDLTNVAAMLDTLDDRDQDQARCWWRLGQCYWALEDPESREGAYRCYITSLKRHATYAPAFTSLGVYYSDFCLPPDPNRASKCFQKAFELDPREAEAARRLAEGFAEEREWDLVEIVARRTIDGEGGLEGGSEATVTTRHQPLNAWAWKAVGLVELNRGRYDVAIKAFQVALRTDPNDQLSWLRLGEANTKAARLTPALKALEQARELKPDDWICAYFLADVFRQMGQYQQAIDAFREILSTQPAELRVLLTLAQTHLEFGHAQLAASFTARAESSFVDAVNVILAVVDSSPGFRRIAWKTAADALFELSRMASFNDPEPIAVMVEQLLPLVTKRPQDRLSSLLPPQVESGEPSASGCSNTLLEATLHAYSYRSTLGFLDDVAAASGSYDLSVALAFYLRRNPNHAKATEIQKEAIRCMKDAVSWDPLNDRYWHTLGDLYFRTHPKTAQHAYIKALEIDNKSFATWTNLGLFYLYHSDVELANEAFYKAQVLNPDYTLAWIGQGLVAASHQDHKEEYALFAHAITLPATVPYADIAFSKRLFDRLNAGPYHEISLEAFAPAFFVLDRLCRRQPHDAHALHLFGLVCERIGHTELAVARISETIALLEAAYEESEDQQIEGQFAIAHTNMGRLRLSMGDYEGAKESFATVTDLLADSQSKTTPLLVTQAYLGSGLAHYKLGAAEEAVESFELAISAAADDVHLRGQAVVLLSQALWALNEEDGRETVKAQLLQSIGDDPDNLFAINALGAMGILTDDENLVDAALSEIVALPLEQRHQRDPRRDVDYLLMQYALAQGDVARARSVAQKSVLLEPSRPQSRRQLATLELQDHNPTSARAILDGAATAGSASYDEARQSLGLRAVAAVAADPLSAAMLAQRAVMLTPWNQAHWTACAYSKCSTPERAAVFPRV